ncbi:MAG: rhomboid family intramembrane serine protease [Pseudomonadota bacterium]
MQLRRSQILGSDAYDPMHNGPQRILNVPSAVLWLIGAIVAAHFALLFAPPAVMQSVLLSLAVIPARYADLFGVTAVSPFGVDFPTGFWAEAAPLFGHAFLHAGLGHLFFNALWLLVFGAPTARRLGAENSVIGLSLFLALFFFGAAAGAFTYVALNPAEGSLLVGASGGVSALMGAAARFALRPVAPWETGRPPLAPLNDRGVVGFTMVWIVINAVMGLAAVAPFASGLSVAWEAHLGGYFFGLLAISPLDRAARAALR